MISIVSPGRACKGVVQICTSSDGAETGAEQAVVTPRRRKRRICRGRWKRLTACLVEIVKGFRRKIVDLIGYMAGSSKG
jgi:hypothetical protein